MLRLKRDHYESYSYIGLDCELLRESMPLHSVLVRLERLRDWQALFLLATRTLSLAKFVGRAWAFHLCRNIAQRIAAFHCTKVDAGGSERLGD